MRHIGLSPRQFAWIAGVSMIFSLPACQDSGPTLHVVKGSLLVDGKPAMGATIILEPMNAAAVTNKPSGTVQEDGSFTLTTHPHGPGVIAGEYAVIVSWYDEDARSVNNPKSKLPARYADPKLSPLPKVMVKPGTNQLEPFRIASKN
jgi:hypothetical protein